MINKAWTIKNISTIYNDQILVSIILFAAVKWTSQNIKQWIIFCFC